MAKQLFVNNFTSTFIANVNATASTGTPATEIGYGILQLNSGASAYLVNPTGGDYYILTAYKRSGSVESNVEIMKVTAVDNSVINECRITVLRAQEGTPAQAYVPGDYISLRITKGGLSNLAQPSDLVAKQDLIGTISGIAKGNGPNALTAAVAEVDYVTPSGAGTLQNKTLDAPTINNDLTASGTGKKFKADFSNATASMRYMFQTTTTNGATIVSALPHGTGTASYIQAYNASDVTNASYAYIGITGSIATINSGKLGTGTALPLVLAFDSAERMRVDGSGLTTATDVSGKVTLGRFSNSLTSAYFALGTGATGYVFQSAGGASDILSLSSTGVLKMTTGSLQEARVAMGSNNIDLSTGNIFTKTISGATTLTVSNAPSSGTVATFILDLTNGGSATVTWWSGMKWAGGTAPTLTAAGRDVLGFFSHDGGTTWTGLMLGKDVK